MVGWTPERFLLVNLVEAVAHLTAVTVAVNSENGKVPDVPPLPRPTLAVDRVRAQQDHQARTERAAKLLPRPT